MYGLVVSEELAASIFTVYVVAMLITGCTALQQFTGYTVVLYCCSVIDKCNVFTELIPPFKDVLFVFCCRTTLSMEDLGMSHAGKGKYLTSRVFYIVEVKLVQYEHRFIVTVKPLPLTCVPAET